MRRLMPRRPNFSIRARIALFGSVIVALTLVLVGLLVYALAAYGGRNDRDRALRDRAEETIATLMAAPLESFVPRRASAPTEIGDADEIFVAILAADGSPIVSTGEIDGAPPSVPLDLLGTTESGAARTTLDLTPNLEARVYVVPWSRPDLGLSGYVVAGQSTQRLREDLNGIIVFLVVAALIGLIAAFAANWRGAGRALRPLRSMAATADEIDGAEDLSRRLPPMRSRDEIGQLTDSFNGMLARLEDAHGRLSNALAREQRFVADASHELRTPLTSIRANADFLLSHPDAQPGDRQSALTDIAAESERMSGLVHDLLTLAHADAGQPLERIALDPLPILEDVRRQARRLYPTREINLVLAPGLSPDSTHVAGDAAALRRLVWIMLDNALRHGGASRGRSTRIWLCLGTSDEYALIRVADDGPGLPAADLDRVFDRFYQADPSRSGGGAGLGLAIARWIVTAHGGRIWARNNDGPGASFFVELPLAAPSPDVERREDDECRVPSAECRVD